VRTVDLNLMLAIGLRKENRASPVTITVGPIRMGPGTPIIIGLLKPYIERVTLQ